MIAIVKTVIDLRNRIQQARAADHTVGLVPTMGALHEGHLTLLRRAEQECGFVVVSIFVNPTQFAPGADYDKYPRDLDADVRLAGSAGADLIFAPAVEEIYPPVDSTIVEVTGPLVDGLCGPHRPGHFRGVTTVCARLFNITGADRAYFGEKDYQQLLVIKRMVQDLHFPLEILPCPMVREPDGLAMSSRNRYLSPEQRQAATVLSRGLFAARDLFAAGERDPAVLIAIAKNIISEESLVGLQYLELRDAETLADIAALDRPAVLALAAFMGAARLIDNVVLTTRG